MKPYTQKALDNNKDPNGMFSSFNNFKKAIWRIFGVSNKEPTADQVIQHLTQKTFAADYAARF